MTIAEVATLLAIAPMSDEERQRWVDALPVLPQTVLLELGKCLKEEQDQLAKLREKYAAKAAKIISKSAI